jgi:hypothetical protein
MTNVTSDILVAVLLDRFDSGTHDAAPETGPACWGPEPVASAVAQTPGAGTAES